MDIKILKENILSNPFFSQSLIISFSVSERLDDPSDKFSVLEFTPSSPPGAFRIRGVESDLYLAMNEKGWLYGERNRLDENTLFTEHALVRYTKLAISIFQEDGKRSD